LVCDRNLDLKTSYKLPICGSKDCIRVYETSACGNIVKEIKHQPEVVDFLLNLLACAASGNNTRGWNRNGLGLSNTTVINNRPGRVVRPGAPPIKSFEPFPNEIGFNSDQAQDIDLLLAVLHKIPGVLEMAQFSSDEQLKVVLDDISPLAFPLLRWVIRSNRAHLSLIPTKKQIKEMNTPWQFQLVNSFPEHEAQFYKWKENARQWALSHPNDGHINNQHPAYFGIVPGLANQSKRLVNNTGSYFAFHGSSITNWHSIVRTGLRSGFVPGIYHAHQAAVSLGYMYVGSSGATGWKNSMFKHDAKVSCISLIEVADMRHDQSKVTGGYNEAVNVAIDHSLVVTRFIFFYPTGPQFVNPSSNPHTGILAGNLNVSSFAFLGQDDEKNAKKESSFMDFSD